MSIELPPEVGRGYRPCVGLMVAAPGRGVFIGRRIGIVGGWQMPQGGVDPGETPEAAAMRELEEETGLTDARIVAVHPEWLTYDLPEWALGRRQRDRWIGQTQKWFLLRYTGDDSGVDLTRHQVEFEEWRWASPAEVLAAIVDFKRPVYEAVMVEMADLAEAIVRGDEG